MPSFEQNLRELEEIVRQLESNELTLEDSIKVFERGQIVSGLCKQELESAESRIQTVINGGRSNERIEDLSMDEDDTNE